MKKLIPKDLDDRRLQAKEWKNRNPASMEKTLQLWYDVQVWQLSGCNTNNARGDLRNAHTELNRVMKYLFAKETNENLIKHRAEYYQQQGYNNF